MALGVAVTYLERLANGARHREAGDGRRLAPQGISAVLDLEESTHGGCQTGYFGHEARRLRHRRDLRYLAILQEWCLERLSDGTGTVPPEQP